MKLPPLNNEEALSLLLYAIEIRGSDEIKNKQEYTPNELIENKNF
jgi:hypothetical protein